MVEAQKRIEGTKKLYFSWSLHDYDVQNEGREDGMKRGREEKACETAKSLLEMGVLSHEQIAGATGLSLAEVEKLAAGPR